MVLTLSTIVAATLDAGMYSMISGMAMKEVKPQASYTIDTLGVNPRVYEFNTKVEPIRHCIVLIASSDKMAAPAMQCYKIEK
ncbi:MAG: hypothetical protein QM497_03325 [Sulfurimonas sp.]